MMKFNPLISPFGLRYSLFDILRFDSELVHKLVSLQARTLAEQKEYPSHGNR